MFCMILWEMIHGPDGSNLGFGSGLQCTNCLLLFYNVQHVQCCRAIIRTWPCCCGWQIRMDPGNGWSWKEMEKRWKDGKKTVACPAPSAWTDWEGQFGQMLLDRQLSHDLFRIWIRIVHDLRIQSVLTLHHWLLQYDQFIVSHSIRSTDGIRVW